MRIKRYCIMLGGVEFATAWIGLLIGVVLMVSKIVCLINELV